MDNRSALLPCSALFPALLCVLISLLFPRFARALETSDIKGDTFEETEGTGLVIRTKPAGARVFIDGVERGQTPYTNNTIRPEQYNIRLLKDGYYERKFRVTLSGSGRMVVSIEMEEVLGRVLVKIARCEGSPAELPLNPLIDGGLGESGETVLNLPVGARTIRVRAFGWEEVVETVNVMENQPVTINIELKPVPFTLSGGRVSRRSFNPRNPGGLGEANFYFSVSAPGTGTLAILDKADTVVFGVSLEQFDTWLQKESWNGRDYFGTMLPEGRYKAVITAKPLSDDSENAAQELALPVQVDYSLAIYPLSHASGISGLLFASVPAALPAGSFQVDALYLFGNFSVPERTAADQIENKFKFFPVELGFRVSALNRLEFDGSFNINPQNEKSTGFGFSVSAKYVFASGTGSFPLGMAAGLSYVYANSFGELPLDSGRGVCLYLPMSLNIGVIKTLFSPGMRWPGPDDPAPRLLLSAGALYQGAWFTAGLSVREEFDWTNSGSRSGIPFSQRLRFHGGLEFNFYPPPSFIVYTLLSGMWIHGDRAGGFGGLGIGLIY